MASQVDLQILLYRIVYGIFIFLISLFNTGLITFLIFKGSVTRSPRRYIIACMSFSNLFLAVFTLVVSSLYPGIFFTIPASKIMILSQVYRSLHSFATGFSLVVLCAELFFRKKICAKYQKNSMILGIFLGGAPWIKGLIIVLPLYLAGTNYLLSKDGDLSSARAVMYVSVIVPACVALKTSVAINLIKVSPVPEFYDNDNVNAPYTNNDMNLRPSNSSVHDYAPTSPLPSSDMNDSSTYSTDLPITYIYDVTDDQPLLHPNPLHDSPGLTVPANQSEPASNYIIPGPTSAPTETQDPYTAAQLNQVTEQTIKKEKTSLLAMSCLYAVIFLPSAILTLAYTLEEKPIHPWVSGTSHYIELLWGIFSPVLWLKFLNNESEFTTRV